MTTECPTHPLTPMPIMDRSSDIRIYLLNVTLVLNASQRPSWQRCAETPVQIGSTKLRAIVRTQRVRKFNDWYTNTHAPDILRKGISFAPSDTKPPNLNTSRENSPRYSTARPMTSNSQVIARRLSASYRRLRM